MADILVPSGTAAWGIWDGNPDSANVEYIDGIDEVREGPAIPQLLMIDSSDHPGYGFITAASGRVFIKFKWGNPEDAQTVAEWVQQYIAEVVE